MIKTRINSDTLNITVENSGSLENNKDDGSERKSSTKTGIENIKKRLALLYPGRHEFELSEKDNRVTAKIIIRGID